MKNFYIDINVTRKGNGTEINMEKFKRIAALLAVGVMIVCALLTLFFALMGYDTAWKASAYCMVIIPVMLYVMMWLAKLLGDRDK